MSNAYAAFRCDEEAVTKGVTLEYEEEGFRVRVALMDETNKGYTKFRGSLVKPLQHKIDTKTITDEEWATVMRTAFAYKGILSWDILEGKDSAGENIWKSGCKLLDGTVVEATPANYLKIFETPELERVYTGLLKVAADYTQFRKQELDGERKNSSQ